jgi:hypothetical protein
MVTEFGFDPLPKKVLDLNSAGMARIKLGAGVEEFTFETSTDPINGAGANVFSVKRRQYNAYESETNARVIESLSAKVVKLENDAAAASGSVLELHASGTTNPSKLHWKYMETMEEVIVCVCCMCVLRCFVFG